MQTNINYYVAVPIAFLLLAMAASLFSFKIEPNTVYAETKVAVLVKDVRDFPPVLKAICHAESGGQQFLANGHVIRGHVDPSDIGICQIHETLWNDRARDMGMDIYTQEGNQAMALWLFDHYGTEPWNSSKSAWIKQLGK